MWVSLRGSKIAAGTPNFSPVFFYFHRFSPVTVYDLFKFPLFAFQSKPSQPTNDKRTEKKKKESTFFICTARQVWQEKTPQGLEHIQVQCKDVWKKRWQENNATQCFFLCLWLNPSWRSLKQGVVSTIESTAAETDGFWPSLRQSPAPKRHNAFNQVAHPWHRLLGFFDHYSKNTQSERFCSHCSFSC